MQFPGAEEGRPIDIGDQRFHPHIIDGHRAGEVRLHRRVRGEIGREPIGPRLFQRHQRRLATAGALDADLFIFGRRFGHQGLLQRIRNQRARHTHSAAGIQHVHHWPFIGRRDPERGVDPAGRRPADQQRHGHARALHFAGDMHHFIEAGRDQAGKPDHVGIMLHRGIQYGLRRHHHAEIDHLEIVALQDHADDILADIVHIALHGRHDDAALGG